MCEWGWVVEELQVTKNWTEHHSCALQLPNHLNKLHMEVRAMPHECVNGSGWLRSWYGRVEGKQVTKKWTD